VRQTVRYVYEDGQRGILNLDAPTAPDPKLVTKVVEILKQGNPESRCLSVNRARRITRESSMPPHRLRA
jgi:hypothetical protein